MGQGRQHSIVPWPTGTGAQNRPGVSNIRQDGLQEDIPSRLTAFIAGEI